MLFHTLPFLVFMLVVLPVFYALQRTPLRIPWLLAASYFFYGWWNPYYLLLIAYSTTLDYLLVALMDHCPARGERKAWERKTWERQAPAWHKDPFSKEPGPGLDVPPASNAQAPREGPVLIAAEPRQSWSMALPGDRALRAAFGISVLLAILLIGGAFAGPASFRPTCTLFALLVLLMAVGAWQASRRTWLLVSLVNNLALLLFFKYARFVISNLDQLLGWMGVSFRFPDPSALVPHGFEYVLPVGISFFTFQSMSYTIDFYLGRVDRERNLLRFATFVCFFPQLMAGPIERARHMLPQFREPHPFRLQNLTDGLSQFLVGLFKKLALANYLSLYVERVYDNPGNFRSPDLMLATFAFAWQIFFDFSGYTDMARGLARMMGFNLILNFNNPYLATGLGDFWTRWHISLSTWFRDYVYIPLGGNRRGAWITYRNLLITFLVSGIWHGANWLFAIWGLIHGLGVIVTRALERSAFYRERVPKPVKQAWVFLYVCFAWIFFRSRSLPDAWMIISRIFGSAWQSPEIPALMLLLVGVVWLYQFIYESHLRPVLSSGAVRVTLAVGMMLYLCLCSSGGGAFIYFQF